MLVCNCRGINEKKVREAVHAGAQRWTDVHAHHGTQPCCGKCRDEICDVISEHSGAQRSGGAPTFLQPAMAKSA